MGPGVVCPLAIVFANHSTLAFAAPNQRMQPTGYRAAL